MNDNNPHETIRDICREFGIKIEDFHSTSRRAHFVRARKECAKRMKKQGFRISDIAFYFKRHQQTINNYFYDKNKKPD